MLGKKLLLFFHCLVFVTAYNRRPNYQQVPMCVAVRPNGASGCPGVTFHFPRANQITDYVRYRRYVPQMKEVTVCGWIETAGFQTRVESVLSYATLNHNNDLAVYFGSPNASIHTGSGVARFKVPSNLEKFHFCIFASSIQSLSKMYLNGTRLATVSTPFYPVTGGGTLVVGQEQDEVNVGELDPQQSFSGNITNLMVWPRVLSDQEIRNVAAECECPPDYAVAMTTHRSELYGNAGYSLSEECPIL